MHSSKERCADGRQLRHAQRAAAVVVVVLEDVGEANIWAEEDRVALRRGGLARIKEGHALIKERCADGRQLRHVNLAVASVVVVLEDVGEADVRPQEHRIALWSFGLLTGCQKVLRGRNKKCELLSLFRMCKKQRQRQQRWQWQRQQARLTRHSWKNVVHTAATSDMSIWQSPVSSWYDIMLAIPMSGPRNTCSHCGHSGSGSKTSGSGSGCGSLDSRNAMHSSKCSEQTAASSAMLRVQVPSSSL